MIFLHRLSLHCIFITTTLVFLVACGDSAPSEAESEVTANNGGGAAIIASTATTPPTEVPAPTPEVVEEPTPESITQPTSEPKIEPASEPVVDSLLVAPEWVTIPSGNVTLGSSEEEMAAARSECLATGAECPEWRFDRATPQETIFVETFKITKHEITNAQYSECVAAGVCQATNTALENSTLAYRSEFSAPANPVVGVATLDASTYCQWIGGRLPSRAEWTRAARGDDDRIYPWGMKLNGGEANLESGGPTVGGSFSMSVSPMGVMDMAGNVWEWTEQDVRLGGNVGPGIVVRGGSWNSQSFAGRIAYLGESLSPRIARYDLGIRCVQDGGEGSSIVQQTEPISTQFSHTDGQLQWLVRHASTATVACTSPLGRSTTGSWQVQIGAGESAPVPENTILCSLQAVGFDGSTASESIQLEAQVSQPQTCASAPAPIFDELAKANATVLGCPTSDLTTISLIAEQPFQGGHMIWREDTDEVYVLYTPTGHWQSDPTWKWDGPNPDGLGLTPPFGLLEPKRGFGWVWRTHLGGTASPLGWALADEQGFENIGQAQSFERGLLLAGSEGKIFVLADEARQ